MNAPTSTDEAAAGRAGREAPAHGRKTALRDKLLPRTIEHAARVPFYRDRWPGRTEQPVTVAGLVGLPVLTRADLAHHTEEMLHPDSSPDVLIHSTGTTTGTPVRRYRSAQEIAAFGEFRTGLSARAQELTGRPARPVVHFTTLTARHHGGTLGAADGTQRRMSLSVLTASEVARSVALLRSPRLFPDLDTCAYEVSGPPDDLMLLAAAVADGGPLEPDRVQRVTSVADYLSRAQSRAIRSALAPSGQVVHRYSMSEVIGGATLCGTCDLFHFDAHVVPEVLSLTDDTPVGSGVGRLVLTELHPFSQCQPFVRYETGDLVERRESPCEPGEISVILVGRTARTPVVEGGGDPLPACRAYPLREALERIPEIARVPLASRIPAFSQSPGAAPLASCTLEPGTDGGAQRLVLLAAVGFSPALLPEAAGELVRRVQAAALTSSPELARLVAGGRCVLDVRLTGDRSRVPGFAVR
ncbi:hypothetical protein [Streptomyces sp. L2]|uniref:hypothetical protein n=1 Tax=Streptomyces sp. L2 TaxID=2162665 RepID=UPI00101015CD|nr:hypothetical protein [Streptomyces sp. L2]